MSRHKESKTKIHPGDLGEVMCGAFMKHTDFELHICPPSQLLMEAQRELQSIRVVRWCEKKGFLPDGGINLLINKHTLGHRSHVFCIVSFSTFYQFVTI